MADLIKTFHAYGKYFEDDLLESFNQFSSKKIDNILEIELSDYSYALKAKLKKERSNDLLAYTVF